MEEGSPGDKNWGRGSGNEVGGHRQWRGRAGEEVTMVWLPE